MLATIIAERYAKALMEAAGEAGQLESVAAEVEALQAALSDDDEIRSFLASPVMAPDKKLQILAGSFPDGVSAVMKSFLNMTILNKREKFLPRILAFFQQLLAEQKGKLQGRVTTAFALSENQQRLLEVELSGRFGRQVSLTPLLDKKLLGGLKLELGDTIYDGTLRAGLIRLGEKLKVEPVRRKAAVVPKKKAAPEKKTTKKKKTDKKKAATPKKKPAKKADKKKK